MLTLLDQLDQGTLWRSPGGIHPPQEKSLSNTSAIARLALAQQYLVPVPQVGESCTLSVKVGDRVLKGMPLTQGASLQHLPVHAPTSGTVIAIAPRPSNHASALPVNTCIIEADGQDSWCPLQASDPAELSQQQILDKVRAAGIAGLGGAAFPSHIKLNPASEIELVIINGVECEPYITSDDRLMREHSDDILAGVAIIHKLVQPQRIVIAIEDNKPEAAEAMTQAIGRSQLPAGSTRVTVIPTKYPSGGEKQLIQIITGKEVPAGAIPAQLGVLVHNVGTAYAIQAAVLQGQPLIERVVTVTGRSIGRPGNYWVPIGTPVAHLLEASGSTAFAGQKIIVGGPMMGHALPQTQVPVLKGTNCILAPGAAELATEVEEKACIRCGECAQVCPAQLLPQQLFWHAKAEEYDKAAGFNLKDCIECGCCSYVCPSDIPLVEYYRVAKSALRQAAEDKLQAERAKQRFEARLQRLEEEKLAREAKAKEAAERRKASMSTKDKDAVAAAMARVQAKKAATETVAVSPVVTEAAGGNKSAAVAAAVARAKAKRAQQAQADSQAEEPAQMQAQGQVAPDAVTAVATTAPADDKQARIAAAVARAKAKKAQQAQTDGPAEEPAQVQAEGQVAPDAVTAVAATAAADDKQARIAAAVARAKAKKAQQAQADSQAEEQVQVPAEGQVAPDAVTAVAATAAADDKQARIAAAVAKAKAKKAASAAKQDKE